MREPISIYCDWALHDELGDTVRLTEEMTLGVLDTLGRWRRDHGVGFDYYLLDCFWFEQPGDYTRFNPETWPGGFEPAMKRMQELGMKPGLWLDTTGGRVAGHKPWATSLDAETNRSYCLLDGPYGRGLRDAMLGACERWGVRMFKFDFADFRAVTPRFAHLDDGEVYARNVAAFRSILREVRAAHPDVVILAYNGFIHLPGYLDNTTDAVVPGIDPEWLGEIDWLYSGDPRPADVPCTSLRRAIDFYQDHMVAKFHRSGIPLDRIDDHGCMVGGTNTIYYLGKRGWRRTWIQSLARGGRKAHFYGDVHLLNGEDVEFLGAARDLFFGLYAVGAGTKLVGGVPCQCPWHGFLTGTAEDGLLVLANSTPTAGEARVPLEGLREARVLFHDEGAEPECRTRGGILGVQLAPEQMVLVGLGEKAVEGFALGVNVGGDAVTPDSVPLPLEFTCGEGTAECTVPGSALRGPAALDGLRVSFRLREHGRAVRDAVPREQAICEGLRIEVEADGRSVEPAQLVPDVQVWSGCSWVTGLYPVAELTGAAQFIIRFTSPDPKRRILADAFLQKL